MNYVAIIFDTGEKIVQVQPFSLPHESGCTTLKAYAHHIGYSDQLVETIYRRGNFSGTEGKSLTIMGPYSEWSEAQARAVAIRGAAFAVECAAFALKVRPAQ